MTQLNYTGAQLNAMLAHLHGDTGSNFRIKTDGTFQILNTTDSKFHAPWIETSLGKPKQKLQTTGEA